MLYRCAEVTGMSGFCDTGLVPLDLQAFTTGANVATAEATGVLHVLSRRATD